MLSTSMHTRRRLSSIGDSAPPSESSEGTSSEHNELLVNADWSHASANTSTSNNMSSVYGNTDDADADDTISIDTVSNTNLSDYERSQVESFFSGLGTEIFVCSSLANLYEGTGRNNDWQLVFTGIPVILHDRGNARARATPRITLVLAERGSSFALWSDRIDYLSNYRAAGPAFHTMCCSTNHKQLIGFSFDSTQAASEISMHIDALMCDPENIALSMGGRKKHKSKQKQKRVKPAPLPPKLQISQPCQFQHVTSVTKDDVGRYFSMQAFAPLKH